MRRSILSNVILFSPLLAVVACGTVGEDAILPKSNGDGSDQPTAFVMTPWGPMLNPLTDSGAQRVAQADSTIFSGRTDKSFKGPPQRELPPPDPCTERPAQVGDGCDQPPGTRTEPKDAK